MADLVDDHHGELHLVGRRRHFGVQQDLLLDEDVEAPVLHGSVGVLRYGQQVYTGREEGWRAKGKERERQRECLNSEKPAAAKTTK